MATELWPGDAISYQPIVSTDGGMVEGFEAFSSRIDTVSSRGSWALRDACEALARWRRDVAAASSLSLSVDMAGEDMLEPDFASLVASLIADHRLDATRVVFDVTEPTMFDEAALDGLRALRKLGFRIDVDEFGTSYSSLAYLRGYPIDRLKVDASFVSGLPADESHADHQIVRMIVAIGKGLGVAVTAQGVANEAQFAALSALGCRSFQGDYFSPPVDEATARGMIGVRLPRALE